MRITLAFDIYGTLIDTNGVVNQLKQIIGDKASSFAQTWRDKQLEYSFRKGLMQRYEPFASCIAQALDYSCHLHTVALSHTDKETLLACYRTLPAFDEVTDALAELQTQNYRLYAFSNGSHQAVQMLLENTAIKHHFIDVISVDEVKTFKPNPIVYQHLIKRTQSTADNTWLISSNPFDVIGAAAVNIRTLWVKRSPQTIFDPWGYKPDITVNHLSEIDNAITTFIKTIAVE